MDAHKQVIFRGEPGIINYTPGSAVGAGAVVVIGSKLGFTKLPILANALGALATRGIADFDKDASVFSQFGPVYWNPTGSSINTAATAAAGSATSTPLGAIYLGRATRAQLTGDITVQVELEDTHDQQQVAYIAVPLKAANASLAALNVFSHPLAVELLSVGFLAQGNYAGIDNADTSVWTVAQAGGTVVTKTYNTATQPTNNVYNDLGALSATYAPLAANTPITLAIANGTTAATPAGLLVVRYRPTAS